MATAEAEAVTVPPVTEAGSVTTEHKKTTGITAKDLKEARLVALENTADAQALSVQSRATRRSWASSR